MAEVAKKQGVTHRFIAHRIELTSILAAVEFVLAGHAGRRWHFRCEAKRVESASAI